MKDDSLHIFLIRHGETRENVKQNYVVRTPDHLVELTAKGKLQSFKNGVLLKEYCDKNKIDLTNAVIWRSPYLRTRQTSEEFNKSLKIKTIKEDITLVEQQFGLFDSLTNFNRKKKYPNEYAEYKRQLTNHGKFYARLPMGESPFDVAIRVHQFLGTIQRDFEKHNTKTLFIFTHGTTMRAFLMRYFHYSPEWYSSEPNPANCSIREIKNNQDMGYIGQKDEKKEDKIKKV